MNRRLFSGSRANRDRREVAFARSVIAEAERRRQNSYITDLDVEAYHSNPPTIVTPEALAQAEKILDKILEAPLATCSFCGAECCDEGELRWHGDAMCVGGMERFSND